MPDGYDIALTIDGTTLYLPLAISEKSKMWSVSELYSGASESDKLFEQTDWSGGFGEGVYGTANKYADGENIDTTRAGMFFLGPAINTTGATGGTGDYDYITQLTGTNNVASYGGTSLVGQTFTPTNSFQLTKITIKAYRTGSPGTVTVGLYNVSGITPYGTALASGTFNGNTITTDTAGELVEITMSAGYSVLQGIVYCIVVNASSGDSSNIIYCKRSASSEYSVGALVASAGTGWSGFIGYSYDMVFKVTGNNSLGATPISFELFNSALYCATPSKVWYWNTSTSLWDKKFASDWAVNTAYSAGDYVNPTTENDYIYECTTAGTSHATTEPTWGTTLDGTTADAGTLVWTCRQIKQLKTYGANMYLAMGNGKYVYTADATTFTSSTAADDSANIFIAAPSETSNKVILWKALTNEVKSSETPTNGGTAWSDPYYIGDTSSNITNLMLSNYQLMVGKSNGLYHLDNDGKVYPLLPELKLAQSSSNFKHWVNYKGSLYFTLDTRIGELTSYLYYNVVDPFQNLIEIEKQGLCVALAADRDYLYAFMDDGTNTICYKGDKTTDSDGVSTWHWCPYITLATNICQVATVVQLGTDNPRLWFGNGDTVNYCVLSDNPTADSSYLFFTQGNLQTGWYDSGSRDWTKILEAVLAECRGTMDSGKTVTVYYQTDESGTWTQIDTAYQATTAGTKKYLDTAVATGKKIKFKIALSSDSSASTPEVKFFAAYGKIQPAYVKVFNFAIDIDPDYVSLSDTKTIKDFLTGGRTSSSLITLEDRHGTSHYVTIPAGGITETEVLDETGRQYKLVMSVSAIESDWS